MLSGRGKLIIGSMLGLLGIVAGTVSFMTFTAQSPKSCGPPSSAQSSTRVISISPSATEIIYEIGAGSLLVGVDRFSNYPPEANALPKIGGLDDPDLERITSLKPDLIILRGRQETIEGLCKDQGIQLYFDPTRSLEDIYHSIREIARLTGYEAQGQRLGDALRSDLRTIQERVAGRPPVRVLFVVSRDKDELSNIFTVGQTSYLTTLIEIAGGVSVFGDQELDYPQVRLESILQADPEIIIDAMPDEPDNPERQQALADQWSALPSIPAVRDRRVFVVTDPYITIPSHRVARLASDMARWFHPEIAW